MKITAGGKDVTALRKKDDQHFARLRTKVASWNRTPENKDKKDINGRDVIEVLELAFALTHDQRYEAAAKAMHLHRLDGGGLRNALRELQRRHGHLDDVAAVEACVIGFDGTPSPVEFYMGEYGYGLRRAVEHAVASRGLGDSFDKAVEKVRKAYKKRQQNEADRQRYLEELHGMRDPSDLR